MRRRAVFVLLLLTALALPLSGDPKLGWIEGTVTAAESGAPLRGAYVAVQSSRQRFRADDDGHYYMVEKAGDYTVVVVYPGRQSVQRKVTVHEGHGTTANIALNAKPLH